MKKIIILLICLLVLSGCSKMRWRSDQMDEPLVAKRPHTLVHRVAEGETLKEIALNYFDDIDKTRVIKADNKLRAEPVSGSELTLKFTNRQWQVISVRMEAIDAYNSGVAAMKQGRSTDALALFRNALDIDSERRCSANSKLILVLVLGSKKRFTTVFPRMIGTLRTGLSKTARNASAVSRISVISSCDKCSRPIRSLLDNAIMLCPPQLQLQYIRRAP